MFERSAAREKASLFRVRLEGPVLAFAADIKAGQLGHHHSPIRLQALANEYLDAGISTRELVILVCIAVDCFSLTPCLCLLRVLQPSGDPVSW